MTQAVLDFTPKVAPVFLGSTYDKPRDHKRLSTQLIRVESLMVDGKWRTLEQINNDLEQVHTDSKFPGASISARLRDLRRHGYVVERRYVGSGQHEYRLLAGQ